MCFSCKRVFFKIETVWHTKLWIKSGHGAQKNLDSSKTVKNMQTIIHYLNHVAAHFSYKDQRIYRWSTQTIGLRINKLSLLLKGNAYFSATTPTKTWRENALVIRISIIQQFIKLKKREKKEKSLVIQLSIKCLIHMYKMYVVIGLLHVNRISV